MDSQGQFERPSSQPHETNDDAGPSPLAALETKFLLMFQRLEVNMLERIELLEAAAISRDSTIAQPIQGHCELPIPMYSNTTSQGFQIRGKLSSLAGE